MGTVQKNPLEAAAAANALSHSAESYENDSEVELAWAIKAYDHAEVHFNLISSVDPSLLRLCPHDNDIYQNFRTQFPDFEVGAINVDELKSPGAKEKWRNFSDKYNGVVENFNYGTLLRLDSTKGISEANTVFAIRIQFLAIEIARNREGHNKTVYEDGQSKKRNV